MQVCTWIVIPRCTSQAMVYLYCPDPLHVMRTGYIAIARGKLYPGHPGVYTSEKPIRWKGKSQPSLSKDSNVDPVGAIFLN